MALDRFGAEVFILLKRHGIRLQRVLTFGRQHFAVHPQEIAAIPGLTEILGMAPELSGTGEKFADPFFRALGADTVESLDASDYESCSRIHDLNEPVPEEWHESYDAVFDGGTLEHVFHFPNAVANAMNLVKPGGVLIIQSPSNNLNGHGFYQFSPELFFRVFDQANGFQILMLALVESDGSGRKFRVEDPQELGGRVTFGGLGPLQLIMVARRDRIETPLRRPPYQSDYSASWARPEPIAGESSDRSGSASFLKPFKQRLRRILPAGWVHFYERTRRARRPGKFSETGIARVETLDACFRKDGDAQAKSAPENLISKTAV